MHDFERYGLVTNRDIKGSVQEQVEEQGLLDKVTSWFGKVKQDRTSIVTKGHEIKTEPIFILLLDVLAQLVQMNPTAFEYKSSYLAFMASELHTNRFWEFI